MRKVLLFLCVLVSGFSVFGQNTTFDNLTANYGRSKSITWFSSNYGSGFGHRILNTDPGGQTLLNFQGRHNSSTWSDILTLTSNGNVGIGTTNPIQKLDVDGGIQSKALVLLDANLGSNSDYTAIYREDVGNDNSVVKLRIGDDALGSFNVGYKFWRTGEWVSTLFVNNYGKVGIGTTSPDAKLAVNGNIHTKEVKVDLIGWADYVFKEDYNLPTLEQVENHIATKGHLINIPSAAEVAENGIQLGEMNAKLLEKIEELTLYTIAQEKKLNTQQKEIEVLKKQNTKINDLEQKLNTLLKTK
ncbi:hypothetical protein [uncultured Aquimarina sp.]|uniref:hypothetical protein n=1 Tax=uncultured Aquimarina sp. TaxID=575652 RepID=UPI00263194EF|nr:hypothetical protein [uncultured Aquimarina sp.]